MDKKEIILCAANYYDDGQYHTHQPINLTKGFVVCGFRHPNCYSTFAAISGDFKGANETTDGFITSLNRFVDREEAAMIAFEAGQTVEAKNKLHSEDLY